MYFVFNLSGIKAIVVQQYFFWLRSLFGLVVVGVWVTTIRHIRLDSINERQPTVSFNPASYRERECQMLDRSGPPSSRSPARVKLGRRLVWDACGGPQRGTWLPFVACVIKQWPSRRPAPPRPRRGDPAFPCLRVDRRRAKGWGKTG